MLVVNINSLDCRNNNFFYQDNLFSGVGFELDNTRINALYEFRDGKNIGNYKCQYFPNDPNLIHVDVDAVQFTGEYLEALAFYENKELTGIVYELENEKSICVAKHFFRNGIPIDSIEWYKSGFKRSFKLKRQGIVQIIEWFEDESLKAFKLHSVNPNKVFLEVIFDEYKKMVRLWIKKDYFDWINKNKDNIEFNYFENQDSFINIPIGSKLVLTGSGIDDFLLKEMNLASGFSTLSSITLSNTLLSEETLLKMIEINSLKEINLRDSHRDLRALAQRLKQKRRDCLIRLDGKEVVL